MEFLRAAIYNLNAQGAYQTCLQEQERGKNFETVLILQGGGSLGAYECGVYKALHKRGIRFDIVAGTSIGAVNASVIAGYRGEDPAESLEEFWLTLAETVTPSNMPDDVRAFVSSMNSAMWGNLRMFMPVWHAMPPFSPYIYDISPLKRTLRDFVDFEKINSSGRPRLVVTSTDIQSGHSCIFDSMRDKLDEDHVVASAGYPFYGISWTEKNGRYLWDGTLLSNTPLTEVIDVSPKYDKKVYIVNLFPRMQKEIPSDMAGAWHRARDIMQTDKTHHTVRMSRAISRQLSLIKQMHQILLESELSDKNRRLLGQMEPEFRKLASERGAVIREITRINRKECHHYLFEDADFSLATIKGLIQSGHDDAMAVLDKKVS